MKRSKIYSNILLPTQKSHQNCGSTVFGAGTSAGKLTESNPSPLVGLKTLLFLLIIPSKGIGLLFQLNYLSQRSPVQAGTSNVHMLFINNPER